MEKENKESEPRVLEWETSETPWGVRTKATFESPAFKVKKGVKVRERSFVEKARSVYAEIPSNIPEAPYSANFLREMLDRSAGRR